MYLDPSGLASPMASPAVVLAPATPNASHKKDSQHRHLFLGFAWTPATPEARALCATIFDLVTDHRRATGAPGGQRPRMGTTSAVLKGFVGDLVAALSSGRLLCRSWHADAFSPGSPGCIPVGGRRAAVGVRDALLALGLLKLAQPHRWGIWSTTDNDRKAKEPDLAAMYRATPAFAALAELHGVDGTRHFVPVMPSYPVELVVEQPRRRDGEKAKPEPIRLPPAVLRSLLVQQDLDQLRQLNAFLADHPLRHPDGTPAFHGLRRRYSIRPEDLASGLGSYGWHRHGRCYARGAGSYQQLSEKRQDGRRVTEIVRMDLTIDGEPVAEIDIGASHLTVIYGLLGHEDRHRWEHDDPYLDVVDLRTGEELPRDVVKACVTPMIANGGNYLRKWLPDTATKLLPTFPRLYEDYPAAAVGEAILAAHPVFHVWKASGLDSLDLMHREGRVLLNAMLAAKARDIPAFPIFDGLLLPDQHAAMVAELLAQAFAAEFGCRPRVKIDRAGSTGS